MGPSVAVGMHLDLGVLLSHHLQPRGKPAAPTTPKKGSTSILRRSKIDFTSKDAGRYLAVTCVA